MERKDLIQRLKDIGVVKRGSYDLRGGGRTNVYYDFKTAFGYPDIKIAICEMLWERMHEKEEKPTCVATQGYGGVPLGDTISTLHGVYHCMTRVKLKDHGIKTSIYGYKPTSKDRVAVLDDVLTTGGSFRDIIDILKPTHAKIIGGYVILKRGSGDAGIGVDYLFTPEDFD